MASDQPTVFLVDDDPAVREALALSLTTAGLAVECFESAHAFLHAYRTDRPGCLLADIKMPEMGGLELQRTLNEIRVRIPIIFMTGHGSIPMSVRAVQEGALDFLEKPLQRPELLQRIQQAFELDAEIRKREIESAPLVSRYESLSAREKEVMTEVVAGNSSKEIARTLGISHRTVDHHRAHIMEKMGAGGLAELVAMAAACKTDL